MQFGLGATLLADALGVASLGNGFALFLSGGSLRLIYNEAQVNTALSLSMGSVSAPVSGYVMPPGMAAPFDPGNLSPGRGIAFAETGSVFRAYVFDSTMGTLTSAVLDNSGLPGASSPVTTSIGLLTGVTSFTMVGGVSGSVAALSNYGQAGLRLFEVNDSGSLTLTDQIADTPKVYLGNISDTASVHLGGQDYLLSLSSLENGLTSFSVDGTGKAVLVDSLGNHDGLAISGPSALQILSVGGQSFAVIASTLSSSISVVRINDMGCLFLADHIVGDRETRIYHPEVLDSFTLNGRVFVVTAGTGAGVAVMELLPGGRLTHFVTGIFETGAGLGSVTGLEVVVTGTTAQIHVLDQGGERMQRFDLALDALGGVVQAVGGLATGSTKGDLVLGGAGDETLQGGGGDDWIIAGGGADQLSGGEGADKFVFAATSDNLRISDFELHQDRIDLSDWGRVYTAAALTISATANGCTITLNGREVTLIAGHSLTAADFTDSDFLF